MKLKVQIDSVFQEETLQIQAPSRTPKIQQVVEFVESLVLLGDLILLNLLLWGFNLFLGTRFWCIHCGSIFQGMTLITLCYLLCNMHSGVILHRPVVRPEQIMIRVLRNMVPFVFFSKKLQTVTGN